MTDTPTGRELRQITAAIARASLAGDAEAEEQARRDLAAAQLEFRIVKFLAGVPALTDAQTERLCTVIREHAPQDRQTP